MHRPSISPRVLVALAFLWGELHAEPALANGKFPAAGQIVVDPGDPAHVLVRATFGILVSRDHCQTFDLICESGAGYTGNIDPGIAVTADGTIIAGIAQGIDVGPGDACSWKLATGAPSGASILDVSVVKSQPSVAVALSVGASGNSVFRSGDNASTWMQVGPALPSTFQGITLDVAPSDPARFYVSGLDKAAGLSAALARSKDGGATWEVFHLPMAGSRAPYLSAVDPQDPDVVYVRLDGTPGALLASKDGGASWVTALSLPGYMQAFALSPDGATVLAGGPSDGLWRASAATYDFKRVSTTAVQCLTWSGAEVYACGASVAVSRSTDAGESFEPLLRLECIRGPLSCSPETPVAKLCPAAWEDLKGKIATQYCEKDAGGGGGGGGGAAGGEITGPTSSAASGGGAPVGGGCGCGAGGSAPVGAGVFLSGILAALAIARRRGKVTGS